MRLRKNCGQSRFAIHVDWYDPDANKASIEIENITEKFKSERNHNSENFYRVITVLCLLILKNQNLKTKG